MARITYHGDDLGFVEINHTDKTYVPFKKAGAFMLTEAEEEAVVKFCEYGATRGNHPDNLSDGPGPLSPFIPAMQALVRKIILSRTIEWRVQATDADSAEVDIGSAL